jgi:hypothetical protein
MRLTRTPTIVTLIVASAMAWAAATPAAALADSWSYTTGSLEAAYNTNAYLSIENDSATTQVVELGIFGGGNAGVQIATGHTFTWKSDCTTTGGCLGAAVVLGSSPDLAPSFYYTPLGASNPTNVPAGGFAFSGPVGSLGDYVSADLSANTAALTSLTNSAAKQQTLLSTTEGEVSGILGSVQSVQSTVNGTNSELSTTQGQVSGILGAVQSVQSTVNGTNGELGTVQSGLQSDSTQQQIAKLDSSVQALTKQVSALTSLLTPKSKKKKKKKKKH